jgi:hypothetical protein
MDPITKWFLVGWCVLAALAAVLWTVQEIGWFRRMDKFIRGEK